MVRDRRIKSLQIIFLMLLAAIILVVWLDQSQKREITGINLSLISNTIGVWGGADVPKTDDDQKRADIGDLVIREYSSNKNSLYLVAIQERGDRHRVHSPINCYTGAGWTLLEKREIVLAGGKTVRRLFMNKDNSFRLVYYWFTNGKDHTTGFLGHLAYYAKDILIAERDAAWVYLDVSADITESIEKTEAMMLDFVTDLDQQRLFDRPQMKER
jgi:EpsI family protein